MIGLQFRLATMNDAELLFRWRNDPDTRRQSHNVEVLQYEEHVAWLRASLVNPNREIRIAELDGRPVGTIRLDKVGKECELSWTVAPQERGHGLGKAILKSTIDGLTMMSRAEIRPGNEASKRIAEYAGMILAHEENGILHYRK
jgi:RimJ/RimL family protein N-acetyltransferase